MNAIAIVPIIIVLFSQAFAQNHTPEESRKRAAILVLLDLSPSMIHHRAKLAQLAPLVEEAMKKSRCDFKVAVAGLHYEDNKGVSMKPWGQPAWVTKHTPDGEQLIKDRISDPLEAIFGREPNEQDDKPDGGKERTYSSLVYSIDANKSELQGMDVVSTLLVSDAAPGFEDHSPSQALQKIKEALGPKTPYISGDHRLSPCQRHASASEERFRRHPSLSPRLPNTTKT